MIYYIDFVNKSLIEIEQIDYDVEYVDDSVIEY